MKFSWYQIVGEKQLQETLGENSSLTIHAFKVGCCLFVTEPIYMEQKVLLFCTFSFLIVIYLLLLQGLQYPNLCKMSSRTLQGHSHSCSSPKRHHLARVSLITICSSQMYQEYVQLYPQKLILYERIVHSEIKLGKKQNCIILHQDVK